MSLVRWARKTVDRNRRSRKAISTIMANLTMLVIVVVLSSLLFVWAISSFGAYQGGAGYWFSSRSLANQERMSVEGTYFYTSPGGPSFALIYIRNVGTIPFTVASVYLNQTLYSFQSPNALQYNVSQVYPAGISPSQVPAYNQNPTSYNGLVCIPGGGLSCPWAHGSWTITVATTRGTVLSITTVF